MGFFNMHTTSVAADTSTATGTHTHRNSRATATGGAASWNSRPTFGQWKLPQTNKLVAIYAPILGACLIGGALTIDAYHNWYDIAAGALIGTIMTFSAYRMVYASIWDFRFNHIPLLRHTPFVYGAGPSSFDGFHDALFTRKAGWGTHEGGAWGGAPFDAADGPRGTMAPRLSGPDHGLGPQMTASGNMGTAGTRVSRKPIGASRHGAQVV